MRLSKIYQFFNQSSPKQDMLNSHRLMLKYGMIKQSSVGIYNVMPLCKLLLDKVESVIKKEINKIGGIEMCLSTIQPFSLWEKSERGDVYGKEMLKINDRKNKTYTYSPTNEEAVVDIVSNTMSSYKNFPLHMYQIQNKFRDEIRPRFGLMRSREFKMFDAYCVHLDSQCLNEIYALYFDTFLSIFKKFDLNVLPVMADNGEIGGDFSHEFHILSDIGESTIKYSNNIDINNINYSNTFINQDIYISESNSYNEKKEQELQDKGIKLTTTNSIEVGHIFNAGNECFKKFNYQMIDKNGNKTYPLISSYGIGVGRLLAAVIETFSKSEDKITLPEILKPFDKIISLSQTSDSEYIESLDNGQSVLYFDIELSGSKKYKTIEMFEDFVKKS